MRLAVIVAAAVVGLAAYASAECANACSGHGTCSTSDQCDCFPNYRAADCSERVCPYGLAWVDSPRGDLDHDGTLTSSNVAVSSFGTLVSYEYEQFPNDAVTGKVAKVNEGHFYSECSNKGACDRATGECSCYDGYTGSSCQRTVCPNDCSGHGVCRTVAEIAEGGLTRRKVDSASGDNFYIGATANEDVFGSSQYRLWDMDMAQSCVCDPGYSGPDCSQRLCPRGDDPLTHRAADCGGAPCTVEEQTLSFDVATDGDTDWGYLTFEDWTGKVWNTDVFQLGIGSTGFCTGYTPFASNDACGAFFENLLEGIPNGVLEDVSVTCTGYNTASGPLAVTVTFTGKPGNVAPLGWFRSNELKARMDPAGTCGDPSAVKVTMTHTTGVVGNEEESACSNRGVCDFGTGLCKCFKGYTMDDCSQQNALAQ